MREPVPEALLEHLDHAGLPVPRVLAHPAIDRVSSLRPFGWSAEAIELNRRHDRPVPHPDPATLARVNGCGFALELRAELGDAGGCRVRSVAELQQALAAACPGDGWVVKAEHGNSGLANRRLRGPGLSDGERRFVEGLLAEDDRLVVEPWLDRERDWAVVFEVPFDARSARVHECFATRDGAMIGALFEPGGPRASPWTERLLEAAERIAARLCAEGYFGPVCVDAFSWRGPDGPALRPLCDLNCRRSMSDPAWRAWRRLAPRRVLYYRFFNRRKLALPGGLAATVEALGERRYERASGRGILIVSPLEVGKMGVFFVADDRTGVFALEAWFRERFAA